MKRPDNEFLRKHFSRENPDEFSKYANNMAIPNQDDVGLDNVHIHIVVNRCACDKCIRLLSLSMLGTRSVAVTKMEYLDMITEYTQFLSGEGLPPDALTIPTNQPVNHVQNVIYLGTLEYVIKLITHLREQAKA